jgi:hypothetical protein
MQRNFEPMRKQVEAWQENELTDVAGKVVIYEAFVEGRLEAPKHLARSVHDLYFEPKYEEFRPRNDLESFQWVHFCIQRPGTPLWTRSCAFIRFVALSRTVLSTFPTEPNGWKRI